MTKSGISKDYLSFLPHLVMPMGFKMFIIPKSWWTKRICKRAINCGGRKQANFLKGDWEDVVVYVSDLDGNVIAFATSIGTD